MKIGVLFPSRFENPGEFLADARAMEAAGADSVWFEESDEGLDPMLALAAIAAVTTDLRLGLLMAPSPSGGGQGGGRQIATLQQLSRNRFISLPLVGRAGEGVSERWQRVEVPENRETWAATLAQNGDGVEGVIVPMDARLLDILRNPQGEIDRPDLILAQG